MTEGTSWDWGLLLFDVRWALRRPRRLLRGLGVTSLAKGDRYLGPAMDWYNGPIWCAGFWWMHIYWSRLWMDS